MKLKIVILLAVFIPLQSLARPTLTYNPPAESKYQNWMPYSKSSNHQETVDPETLEDAIRVTANALHAWNPGYDARQIESQMRHDTQSYGAFTAVTLPVLLLTDLAGSLGQKKFAIELITVLQQLDVDLSKRVEQTYQLDTSTHKTSWDQKNQLSDRALSETFRNQLQGTEENPEQGSKEYGGIREYDSVLLGGEHYRNVPQSDNRERSQILLRGLLDKSAEYGYSSCAGACAENFIKYGSEYGGAAYAGAGRIGRGGALVAGAAGFTVGGVLGIWEGLAECQKVDRENRMADRDEQMQKKKQQETENQQPRAPRDPDPEVRHLQDDMADARKSDSPGVRANVDGCTIGSCHEGSAMTNPYSDGDGAGFDPRNAHLKNFNSSFQEKQTNQSQRLQ